MAQIFISQRATSYLGSPTCGQDIQQEQRSHFGSSGARIVSSIEPAKKMTRTKEPEFMFLHTKDFWFRSIWIDLHQALTIDRASSRDRAPVGLVRCVCKDDQIKGPNAPVKFKLSNIHAFVPIWMAPSILKNFRLIAAQCSPLSDLGRLDYREGWFAITPKEGQTGETLCGLQVHLSDDNLVEFSHRNWLNKDY